MLTKSELISAVTQAVDVLNHALQLDYDAVYAACFDRVFCNQPLAEHETIQVHARKDEKGEFQNSVGLIGWLNGFFGIKPNGSGYLQMLVEEDGTLTGFVHTIEDSDFAQCETWTIELGTWRHRKTQTRYRVLGLVINSTNGDQDGQSMVHYTKDGKEFVRNFEEFLEKFIK